MLFFYSWWSQFYSLDDYDDCLRRCRNHLRKRHNVLFKNNYQKISWIDINMYELSPFIHMIININLCSQIDCISIIFGYIAIYFFVADFLINAIYLSKLINIYNIVISCCIHSLIKHLINYLYGILTCTNMVFSRTSYFVLGVT
jgi:hypothetical protein